jgi:hypothetical protein
MSASFVSTELSLAVLSSIPDGVMLNMSGGGGHVPMIRRGFAGNLLYAYIHWQLSHIRLGTVTVMLVDSFFSIENLGTTASVFFFAYKL